MTQIVNQPNGVNIVSYETWAAAIASSACIGFTSLVPWLFNLTFFEQDKKLTQLKGCENGNDRMKYLLSFAVGAILGDIFFHLIPESYQAHLLEPDETKEDAHKKVGISIIAGIFMFIIVEMILEKWSSTPASIEVERLLAKSVNETEFKQAKVLDKLVYNSNDNEIEQSIPIFKNKSTQDLKRASFDNAQNNNVNDTFKDVADNNNSSLAVNLNQNAQTKQRDNVNLSTEPKLINHESSVLSFDSMSCDLKRRILSTTKSNREAKIDDAILMTEQMASAKIVKRKVSAATTTLIATAAAVKTAPPDVVCVDAAGYLNLIANGFDNFTHGLAIGASFLIGSKVGLLTTFVIIIHEIPHEICDYAILVNSGFTRWEAVKAQSSVSLFGIIGTATALYVKSVETLNSKTVWILPFSSGGFLYIALVNLLPEILDRKTDLRNSIGQVTCVILGIIFMALVAIF